MTSTQRMQLDPAKARESAATGIVHERSLASHLELKSRSDMLENRAALANKQTLRDKLLLQEKQSHRDLDQSMLPKLIESRTQPISAGSHIEPAKDPETDQYPDVMPQEDEKNYDSDSDDELLRELKRVNETRAEQQHTVVTKSAKRSWRDDAVFSKRRSTPASTKPTGSREMRHFNDTVHSESHHKFMDRYVQ